MAIDGVKIIWPVQDFYKRTNLVWTISTTRLQMNQE